MEKKRKEKVQYTCSKISAMLVSPGEKFREKKTPNVSVHFHTLFFCIYFGVEKERGESLELT